MKTTYYAALFSIGFLGLLFIYVLIDAVRDREALEQALIQRPTVSSPYPRAFATGETAGAEEHIRTKRQYTDYIVTTQEQYYHLVTPALCAAIDSLLVHADTLHGLHVVYNQAIWADNDSLQQQRIVSNSGIWSVRYGQQRYIYYAPDIQHQESLR